MDNRRIFLNNNKGNIILEPGSVYEVAFPNFKTIMRFMDRGFNGYSFQIIDKCHLMAFQRGHDTKGDFIVYERDMLRSAVFKTSIALNVLYGNKTKE